MNQFEYILSLFDVKTPIKTIKRAISKVSLSSEEIKQVESLFPSHQEWLDEPLEPEYVECWGF